MFWSQGGSTINDGAKLRIAVATDCKKAQNAFLTTVARSDASRGKGLSGRTTPLAGNEAMLFVFDPPNTASFWMKNTLIPLTILFFNTKGVITNRYNMPVEKDPAQPKKKYPSQGEVIAALEISQEAGAKLKQKHASLCVDTVAP